MMTDSDSRNEALASIKEYPADHIINEEAAREIAAPFELELSEDDFEPLEEIAPVYYGDPETPAIGLDILVVQIAKSMGLSPEWGKSAGRARYARETVNETLPKIERAIEEAPEP